MRPTNINRSREVHCLDSCVSSFFILVQSALIEMGSEKKPSFDFIFTKILHYKRSYIQDEIFAILL